MTSDVLHRPAAKPAKGAGGDSPTYILTLSCPDKIGVVADVAAFMVAHDCNIIESGQFTDQDTGRFFLRSAFRPLTSTRCVVTSRRSPTDTRSKPTSSTPRPR
jgi:formyltetrahydrofolate hydrolase